MRGCASYWSSCKNDQDQGLEFFPSRTCRDGLGGIDLIRRLSFYLLLVLFLAPQSALSGAAPGKWGQATLGNKNKPRPPAFPLAYARYAMLLLSQSGCKQCLGASVMDEARLVEFLRIQAGRPVGFLRRQRASPFGQENLVNQILLESQSSCSRLPPKRFLDRLASLSNQRIEALSQSPGDELANVNLIVRDLHRIFVKGAFPGSLDLQSIRAWLVLITRH